MTEYFDSLTEEQQERVVLGTRIIFATLVEFGLAFRAPEEGEEDPVILIPVEDTYPQESRHLH